MNDKSIQDHNWSLVMAKGNDSIDTISYCINCGTVKHDYNYHNGKKSPNYPRYFVRGKGADSKEPLCQ